MKARTIARGAALALVAAAGCGADSDANRSPTTANDPARAARASEQAAEVEAANRAAEAAYYRSRGLDGGPAIEDEQVGERSPGA